MNFFETQERARRASRMLVLWFALSVAGVIAVMYGITVVASHYVQAKPEGAYEVAAAESLRWWRPDLLLWVAVIAGGVILFGSLSKLAQLSAGGKVVARDLGGREVEPGTTDRLERRLLNVVEEMAIASGVAVPGVWVMDEERGINAFAAGTDPTNAVVGVTRGTLERLSRAELQGVVAHEFSHILNGDMKLNMRLMGWIFGLVMLAMLGRVMLEAFRFMGASRNSRGGGGKIVLAIVVAGLAVWLVGSIGVFFARMLQAAISRQREYLADASAVQFTRDPGGIAGALRKIGGFSMRGKISSAKATEARHMFFTNSALSRMMATHPPLEKRIRAIDPRWDGEMLKGKADAPGETEFSGAKGFAGGAGRVQKSDGSEPIGESGRLDSHVGAALLEDVRAGRGGSFSKDDAKCLLLGMLTATDGDGADQAGEILRRHEFGESEVAAVRKWAEELAEYGSEKRLATIDLSLPLLRRMNRTEAEEFVAASGELAAADGQIDLFEFVLQQVIRRHVEIGLGLKTVPSIRYRSLAGLEGEIAALLAAFAELAGDEGALENAAGEYAEHTGRELPRTGAGLSEVAGALEKMDAATPLVKQRILRLCALVVTHDGKIEGVERELLRAAAEAMGAPIPPLVRMVAGVS